MSEAKKVILFEKENNIGILTHNDPPLNLYKESTEEELVKVLDVIEADPELDVVVFRSIGKYFGAGHDVNEFQSQSREDYLVKFDLMRMNRKNTFDRISEMKIPFIAALDGSAYGGAFERALACDLRIAAKNIVCCLPEVKFGTFPGEGGVPKLIEIIGPARTMEFMLRATKITAEDLYNMGVINKVVEEGKAFETAMEWAREIAAMPSAGIRSVKEAISTFLRPAREEFYPKQQALSKKIYMSGDLAAASERFAKREGVFDK